MFASLVKLVVKLHSIVTFFVGSTLRRPWVKVTCFRRRTQLGVVASDVIDDPLAVEQTLRSVARLAQVRHLQHSTKILW